MTVQEAIKHCKEKAKEKYAEGMLCHANPNDDLLDGCIKCAKEHEQLAEWLKELEQYRALGTVEELKEAKKLLEKLEELKFANEQPKTDWIPCEVEMPKDETLMYWTTHEDGSIIMHGYLKRNGFIYNWEVDDLEKRKRQGKVVAWMPIFKPQPYKKEGAENDR